MNLPEDTICEYIDRMTDARCNFAIYRLPWTDCPIMVLQDAAEANTVARIEDLNGKCGFVMIPFDSSQPGTIVCIRPDHLANGWEEIEQVLGTFKASHPDMSASTEAKERNERSSDERRAYTERFSLFMERLHNEHWRKLVLSRHSAQRLPDGFSPIKAFVRACNSYPRMMISLCSTPVTGTWIGSTPEIILSGHDTSWQTVALAGTMRMNGETAPTEWSAKNREEQAYVSEYIRATLRKFTDKVTENGPYTARAGQLVHLKTDFLFSLKDTSRLGDILKVLHPTPAVCGLPKDESLQFIRASEGYNRKYYSGIIGWMNPSGESTLYVNLRCMHLSHGKATLFAGGGILPSSDADAEWEETEEKMNTMRNIISV